MQQADKGVYFSFILLSLRLYPLISVFVQAKCSLLDWIRYNLHYNWPGLGEE